MPVALRRLLYPLLYATFLLVFAFLFAPLGFNPTDDGVVLAQTARFWSGQIPFIDFVSIRPFGSVLLHWPALLFGDYRLLASRYLSVVEIGFYSYAFLSLTINKMRVELSELAFWSLAGISFALNVHSFPLMAWTTIDALFLVAAGLYLRSKITADSWWNILAYALLSLAALCRQTFLPVAFLAIWFFQDIRNWRAFIGIVIPFVFFLSYLWWNNCLDAALQQLTVSSTSLRDVLKILLQYKGAYFGLLIGASVVIAWQWQKHKHWPWMSWSVVAACFGLAIATMLFLVRSNSYRFLPITLWIALIPMIGSELRFHRASRHYAIGVLAFFIVGLTALSIGYPSPALAMAWPWAILLLWTLKRFTPLVSLQAMTWISLIVILIASGFLRLNYIYREPHSEQLQYKTKHPGLHGIWMDKHTAEALNELYLWKTHLKGLRSVLFDFAACRIYETDAGIKKGDWLTQEEFPSKALQESIYKQLSTSNNRYWIVQKYCSAEMSDTLIPIESRNDSMQRNILQLLKKRSIIYNEGKYFIVYRQ